MKATPEFTAALTKLVAGVQEMINAHYRKNLTNLTPPTLTVDDGSRYSKIVVTDAHGSRSVYGFVDKKNGDLLKSASWNAPAKHARGNLFHEATWTSAGLYGFAYIKGPNVGGGYITPTPVAVPKVIEEENLQERYLRLAAGEPL